LAAVDRTRDPAERAALNQIAIVHAASRLRRCA
jgi:hypothetical protein